MYAHFYQLSESPFNLTPDPKFHYINESTREAMASILHGIKQRKGFLTLIGEAGTGKTTLLKRILDEIEGETQVVFVFNPGVSFDELLEFICMELGVTTDGRRRLQLLDRLNAHLLQQLTNGRNVVVMIDEAQTLEDSVLEELRLLSNLETAKEKILQILLSGQPELEDKLRRPGLRQLRQRIAVRATLKPMRPDEIGPYVETRLRSAGAERNDFFTPPALRKVWQASRGIARVANVVCDNAMMIAFAEGKRRITSRVMAEAVRDLHGQGSGGGMVDTVRSWASLPAVRYTAGALIGLALAVPFVMSIPNATDSRPVSIDVGSPSGRPATAAGALPPAPKTPEPGRAELRPVVAGADVAEAADPGVDAGAASDADGNFRISGTIRDSVRRAEVVARSTAARLYHSRTDGVEPSAELALSPPTRVSGEPDPIEQAGSVDDDGKAIASLDEPVEFERGPAHLAIDPAADKQALATLRHPLGDTETGAFVGDEDVVSQDDERMVEESTSVAAIAAPVAARSAVQPNGRPEPKPVKAGSLELDASSDEAVAAGASDGDAKARNGVAETPPAAKRDGKSWPGADDVAGTATASSDAAPKHGLDAAPAKTQPGELAGASPQTPQPPREDPDAAPAPIAATPAASVPVGVASHATDLAAATAPEVIESGGMRTMGLAPDEPIIGQLVRVLAGDSVWDIAIAYYGTAGPVTLKRILNGNPGIRDPRHLEVGAHIYLPFQRPEQMVLAGTEGTYRVLLAVAPEESRLAPVRAWIESFMDPPRFTTSVVSGAERSYQLHAVGLTSREAAIELATAVLDAHDRRKRPSSRRSA